MQGLRLQFHKHAAARQAAGNEGSGADTLCHGQYELLQHRSPFSGSAMSRFFKWVRNEARRAARTGRDGRNCHRSRASEMWHFLKKRLASSGFGGRMTLSLAAPSPGCRVAVMTPPPACPNGIKALWAEGPRGRLCLKLSSNGWDPGQNLPDRRLGRLSPPHSAGSTLHRQKT